MAPILRYGLDSSLAVEPCTGTLLGQCGSPQVKQVDDVRAEVRRALREPLDYPPFSTIATPGDRVVLALSAEVPNVDQIVAAVVDCLVEDRVDPEAITVLRPARSAQTDPCRLLPESIRRQINSVSHEPQNREALSYLATTRQGQSVLLHRAIVDADLVVPIGYFRGHASAGYHGIHTPVYPTYSHPETLRRFHSPATLDARGRHRKQLSQEADEVGWLLGVAFTIQVFPAAGDHVYCVLAGHVDGVQHHGMELFSKLWHHHVPRRAGVVVAALEGNAAQQSWSNLGRALETGTALVVPGGGLALCTELAARPGSAVECLRTAHSPADALQRIRRDNADDAITAIQLARALDHCSVYLLSRLDDALVEDLQMTPVADASDLVRLANRAESFVLLGNASYARVTVEDDVDA